MNSEVLGQHRPDDCMILVVVWWQALQDSAANWPKSGAHYPIKQMCNPPAGWEPCDSRGIQSGCQSLGTFRLAGQPYLQYSPPNPTPHCSCDSKLLSYTALIAVEVEKLPSFLNICCFSSSRWKCLSHLLKRRYERCPQVTIRKMWNWVRHDIRPSEFIRASPTTLETRVSG